MSRELHLLPPAGRPFLEADDLVRRLRAEFSFVETSHDEGVRRLQQLIARWERTDPRVFENAGAPKGSGPESKTAHLAKLRAALAVACYVRFGDDCDHAHGQLITPGDNGLLIVADAPWQERLAERCARVTGYLVHEI